MKTSRRDESGEVSTTEGGGNEMMARGEGEQCGIWKQAIRRDKIR